MHWGDKCLKEQIPNFSCCDFYTLPACTKISHAPYKYICLLCIHNSFFKFKTGSWTESGKKISLTWISKHKRQVFIFFLICSWIVFVFYLCCSHFFWHLKFLSLLINFFFYFLLDKYWAPKSMFGTYDITVTQENCCFPVTALTPTPLMDRKHGAPPQAVSSIKPDS